MADLFPSQLFPEQWPLFKRIHNYHGRIPKRIAKGFPNDEIGEPMELDYFRVFKYSNPRSYELVKTSQ